MSFVARFLGIIAKAERGGIRLDEPEPWRVSPTKDVELFVRALPLLTAEGSVAYFEGTGESHVAEYLRRLAIVPQVQVAVGTIWPRPDYYHVPVSRAKPRDQLSRSGRVHQHCRERRRLATATGCENRRRERCHRAGHRERSQRSAGAPER